MKTKAQSKRKHAGGRPPKFREPRRPITVTLPDRTLMQLAQIHDDRARAIVKAVDNLIGVSAGHPAVDIVEMARGVGLLVVGPSRALRQITWLNLIEIAPARYLLSVPPGSSVDSLEIALGDVLETDPRIDEADRALVEELRSRIKGLRRQQVVSRSEILLVDIRDHRA